LDVYFSTLSVEELRHRRVRSLIGLCAVNIAWRRRLISSSKTQDVPQHSQWPLTGEGEFPVFQQ